MAGGFDDEATSFDLTALLDILSNIIFFLMASFGAAVVATIPTKVPTISEGNEDDIAKELDKVTVTMTLDRSGQVEISAANHELLPSDLEPLETVIPGQSGTIDAERIEAHLWSIKEKYRASQDLVLVPEPDVTYEMMIQVMDASREREMVVEGKKVFPSLFPAVVVSSKAR
ncbi:MAG: biopolymer transporter ExbD [Myxococcota bacterium]